MYGLSCFLYKITFIFHAVVEAYCFHEIHIPLGSTKIDDFDWLLIMIYNSLIEKNVAIGYCGEVEQQNENKLQLDIIQEET